MMPLDGGPGEILGEEEWEEHAYFEGSCTCPPECPNAGDDNAHGWGDCGGELPSGRLCPCLAGWEE